MMRIITINFLLSITVIFRFLAIHITQKALKSERFEEINPISRRLLKKPKNIYIYHYIIFSFNFIYNNIIVYFFPKYFIIILIAIVIPFVVVLFDYLYDLILFKNANIKTKELIKNVQRKGISRKI